MERPPVDFYALPGWRTLVGLAALRNEVPVSAIMGPSRATEVVRARHDAIELIWTHCGRGSSFIAQRLGLDPTTVLEAMRKRQGLPRRGGGSLRRAA
jgi:chromosomal replication initiation ATPase DnaA